MKLEFRVPTKSDVEDILTWKFEGIYSFYDNDIDVNKMEWIKSIVDSDNDFAIYDEHNRLIGNCGFEYIDESFCVGVQMRPDITGKGFGTEFVKAIVEFGKQKYNLEHMDLMVTKFNKRAIRVYEKLGFKIVEEFVNTIRGNDYDFMAMRLEFDK